MFNTKLQGVVGLAVNNISVQHQNVYIEGELLEQVAKYYFLFSKYYNINVYHIKNPKFFLYISIKRCLTGLLSNEHVGVQKNIQISF